MSEKEFNQWHINRNIDLDLNTPWHKYFIENLSKIELNHKSILEIGCGRGGFAFYLRDNFNGTFKDFIAADFSETAISMCKEFAHNNSISDIRFEVQDIQNIQYNNDTFDLIISFETIEHVPNCNKAINELYRILKPGGILFLSTPNYLGFFGLYRIYLRLTGRKWTEVGQPINRFVMIPRTLFWLKNAGFKIINFDSTIISFPWFGTKKVYNLNWIKPRFIFKWFGLQSFFLVKK